MGGGGLKKGCFFSLLFFIFAASFQRESQKGPRKSFFFLLGLSRSRFETMMASSSCSQSPRGFLFTPRLDVKLPFPPMWTFRRRRPVARLGFGSGDLASRSSLVRRRYVGCESETPNESASRTKSNLDLIAISRSLVHRAHY